LNAFQVAFHHALPHGVLTAITIPDSPDPVPDSVLSQLFPAEAEHARTLRGYRQGQFVGGRMAVRRACEQLGVRAGPVLSDPRGAPILPRGFTGSVSHKRTLAVGMVAHRRDGTLGVDLEDYGPPRPSIASQVLRPSEVEAIASLPEARRWIALLIRFSIKESIYKALDPFVQRYVAFEEAEVTPDLQGLAEVQLHLDGQEGPFAVDARYTWMEGRLLTSVRIQPATDAPSEPPTAGPEAPLD